MKYIAMRHPDSYRCCNIIANATSKEDKYLRVSLYWGSSSADEVSENIGDQLDALPLDQWKRAYLLHLIGYDIMSMIINHIPFPCYTIERMHMLLLILDSDTLPLTYDGPTGDDIRTLFSSIMSREDIDTIVGYYIDHNEEEDAARESLLRYSTRIMAMATKAMDESL